MESHQKIAMVILAAGASIRMKAIKQLLPWKKTSLLGHSIEQSLSSKVDSVFVVLGANKEKIAPTLKDYNIQIIENEDWRLGLGKSIACAIQFLDNSPTQFNGVLIALADQPLLTASYYNKLIVEFKESKSGIVSTQQNSTIGVPAVFNENYYERLSFLYEDRGAKALIKQNLDDVRFVNPDGIALDVDTIDSYQELFKKYGS
ncbi:nucleotidyltransferase family protein [Aureibaculum conchae]|uniref:nucleotidyltransferase family protein n=1 Tax=Aureibaculum sp. 2308TA14-22 TaxID=3108392 RepID=UPI003390C3E6